MNPGEQVGFAVRGDVIRAIVFVRLAAPSQSGDVLSRQLLPLKS
jgi:hypothetical protein